MIDYKKKYLKYKIKYIEFKKKMTGGEILNLQFEYEQRDIILNKIKEFCQDDNNIQCKIIDKKVKILENENWDWNKIKKMVGSNSEIMTKYFNLRKEIIDELINNVFEYFNCTELKCQKNYSGSVGADANLFSDYDLTIVNQNLKTSQIIQIFNSIIFNVFDCTPAEAFDTNLYGYSCIIPSSTLFKNKKTWLQIPFDENKYYLPQKELNIEQDKWAVKRLLTFIKDEKINISIINDDIINWLNIPMNDINNLKIIVRAKLYIEKMEIFEKTLKKYNDDNYNNETNTLDETRDKMIDELSYMNLYGDETYFTTGSFMHVVGTMFYFRLYDDNDKIKILTHQQIIHSMIENLSYFIHTMNAKNNDVIIGTKYLERFFNGYKLYLIKKNILISENIIKILNLLNLIKNHYRNRADNEIINYEKKYLIDTNDNIDINIDVKMLKLKKINELDNLILSLEQNNLKNTNLNEFNKCYLYTYILLSIVNSCIDQSYTNIRINLSNENNIIISII